jgi:GT2 family glycosyltransferase
MKNSQPASNSRPGSGRPSISIVIPSLNSPIINEVVTHILAQDASALAHLEEIVIVGRDEPQRISQNNLVQFVDTIRPITAAQARNVGITHATGEHIIFLDSDCFPQPGWLQGHIDAWRAGHRVVSGSVLPVGDNYWHLSYNLTLFHEILSSEPVGPRDFLASLNLAVARKVIDRVGGMDEMIVRVEDVDWTTRMRRAGFQPVFWPDAIVRHQHNRTTLPLLWQDCAASGFNMRTLRLAQSDLLQAPGILRYPKLVLLLSPAIALWATVRIMLSKPAMTRRFWRTLPAIYVSKIAWCWGASRNAFP